MYTKINFPTKKALKEAIALGKKVRVYSPGPFPCPENGNIFLEGPHYSKPHRWHSEAVVKDGVVVSAK